MDEVFPVLSGVVVGLVLSQIAAPRLRALLCAALSLVLGFVASWISGELAVSPLYVLVDAGQVVVAAVLTLLLVAAWRRRAWARARS